MVRSFSLPQFWFQTNILDFNAVHPALFNNKILPKEQILSKVFVLFSLIKLFCTRKKLYTTLSMRIMKFGARLTLLFPSGNNS